MKKAWYAILVTLIPWATPAGEVKVLTYDYSDIVSISISNSPCPLEKFSKQFPYVAIAVKYTDAQHTKVADAMNACWTHKGDTIYIQWQGGDHSEFPANFFLQGKML